MNSFLPNAEEQFLDKKINPSPKTSLCISPETALCSYCGLCGLERSLPALLEAAKNTHVSGMKHETLGKPHFYLHDAAPVVSFGLFNLQFYF